MGARHAARDMQTQEMARHPRYHEHREPASLTVQVRTFLCEGHEREVPLASHMWDLDKF
jgi:hypothetical protein